jgi:Arc/MetJ-type ribon-helix-helix transcriptional regulator|tara:strand:+ start:337 stop:555 length:219 start_codon:yes stop_codon:yes gene_type:complete
MKLSVSLPDDDVEYLDEYARAQRLESRSAALRKAIRLLRASELGSAYEDAWTEWAESEDDQLWGAVVDDGLA